MHRLCNPTLSLQTWLQDILAVAAAYLLSAGALLLLQNAPDGGVKVELGPPGVIAANLE